MKKLYFVMALLIVASMVLGACGAATPVYPEERVVTQGGMITVYTQNPVREDGSLVYDWDSEGAGLTFTLEEMERYTVVESVSAERNRLYEFADLSIMITTTYSFEYIESSKGNGWIFRGTKGVDK